MNRRPGLTFILAGGALSIALSASSAVFAAPLGLDADECAVQRALLGKAGPGCPPEPPRVEPPAAPAPPPAAVVTPPPIQAAPPPLRSAQPTVTPPQPAPPAVVAERKADFLILFDFASAKIAKQSEPLLTRIAAAMNAPAAADMRFDVVGHTDGVGAAAANLTLSQRRAAAIKVWLAKEGGVDARRLNAYGKGEEQLADPAQPAAAANRRVEIITRPASP